MDFARDWVNLYVLLIFVYVYIGRCLQYVNWCFDNYGVHLHIYIYIYIYVVTCSCTTKHLVEFEDVEPSLRRNKRKKTWRFTFYIQCTYNCYCCVEVLPKSSALDIDSEWPHYVSSFNRHQNGPCGTHPLWPNTKKVRKPMRWVWNGTRMVAALRDSMQQRPVHLVRMELCDVKTPVWCFFTWCCNCNQGPFGYEALAD